MHREHHKNIYEGKRNFPDIYSFFFWFGSWKKTLDVLIMFTFPALLYSFLLGGSAYWLIIFHYLYEVFFADELLELNKQIKGKITKYFAIGDYHMDHHRRMVGNYSSIFVFWDFIFGTKLPK